MVAEWVKTAFSQIVRNLLNEREEWKSLSELHREARKRWDTHWLEAGRKVWGPQWHAVDDWPKMVGPMIWTSLEVVRAEVAGDVTTEKVGHACRITRAGAPIEPGDHLGARDIEIILKEQAEWERAHPTKVSTQ